MTGRRRSRVGTVLLAGLGLVATTLAGCGDDDPDIAIANEVRLALGDEAAACVADALDRDELLALNEAIETGAQPDPDDADAYAVAVARCADAAAAVEGSGDIPAGDVADDQVEGDPDATEDDPDAEGDRDSDSDDGSGDLAAEDRDAAIALTFFRDTETACLRHTEEAGNPPPEPDRFRDAIVSERLDMDRWLVTDGRGDELIVDVAAGVVTSIDGPDGVLPRAYSFGCPEDLYLGTLDH